MSNSNITARSLVTMPDNTGVNFFGGTNIVNIPMSPNNQLGHSLLLPQAPATSVTGRFIGTTYFSQGIGMGDNSTLILDNNVTAAWGITGLKLDNT
ncbi:MAG: hypothetical protein RCG15_02995 [Candidatus Rickettsia vulgarisii]